MSAMNISLPEALKAFVDEQIAQRGYGTSSECLRGWPGRDQGRPRLRDLPPAGAASELVTAADSAYFEGLRKGRKAVTRSGARRWR